MISISLAFLRELDLASQVALVIHEADVALLLEPTEGAQPSLLDPSLLLMGALRRQLGLARGTSWCSRCPINRGGGYRGSTFEGLARGSPMGSRVLPSRGRRT